MWGKYRRHDHNLRRLSHPCRLRRTIRSCRAAWQRANTWLLAAAAPAVAMQAAAAPAVCQASAPSRRQAGSYAVTVGAGGGFPPPRKRQHWRNVVDCYCCICDGRPWGNGGLGTGAASAGTGSGAGGSGSLSNGAAGSAGSNGSASSISGASAIYSSGGGGGGFNNSGAAGGTAQERAALRLARTYLEARPIAAAAAAADNSRPSLVLLAEQASLSFRYVYPWGLQLLPPH